MSFSSFCTRSFVYNNTNNTTWAEQVISNDPIKVHGIYVFGGVIFGSGNIIFADKDDNTIVSIAITNHLQLGGFRTDLTVPFMAGNGFKLLAGPVGGAIAFISGLKFNVTYSLSG